MIDKIADFLQKIVDRAGTKFLIALFGIFALWDLSKTDQLELLNGIFIVGAILIFYVFKFCEEKFGLNGSDTKTLKGEKD